MSRPSAWRHGGARSPLPGWRPKARTSCRSSAHAAATGWTEALGAASFTLSPEDFVAIEQAVPKDAAAGERYAPAQMASLDSERG